MGFTSFRGFVALLGLGLWGMAGLAQPSNQAAQAVDNGVQASSHASASAAHSIAASGQVTSGLLAMPILASGAVVGSAGVASAGAGQASLGVATQPIGKGPLPLTDETISVIAPDQALKAKLPAQQ
jgi:hypothetical protein